MTLPVLEIPEDVSKLCALYKPKFSRPQFKQFEKFITGLMISDDADVESLAEGFRLSQSYDRLHHFASESPWDINDVLEQTVGILKNLPADRRLHEKGMLIIDDTLIEKYGKLMSAVGKLWDHSKNRWLEYAHCLIGLCWADHHKLRYPLRFEVYRKREDCPAGEFKTKITFAIEMINWAVEQGVPFQTVVFDSWFFCKEIVNHVESLGKDWIAMSKTNRVVTVKGKQSSVGEYAQELEPEELLVHELKGKEYAVKSVQARFQCLKRGPDTVRLLVSFEKKGGEYKPPAFMVSNRKDIRPERLIRAYQIRWNIETFFKDAKSHLGLGRYQMRRLNGIKSHWCLVFTSAVFLELVRWKVCTEKGLKVSEMTFGDLKQRAFGQTLRAIVRAAVEYAKNGLECNQIFALLDI